LFFFLLEYLFIRKEGMFFLKKKTNKQQA